MKNSSKKTALTRRQFISRTVVGTAAVAITPFGSVLGENMQQSNWPANSSQFKFHMIGHAHIDPVWLWRWTEGVSIVHSTFQSALDRMNENPEFCFISSSAQFYHWVAENDPEMLEKIKKRIVEGRWNVVGGWWVEPDVNIPSGEAMVRQGLYGQLTLQKLVGRRATIAFNPDSFGHTSTLPQIISKQGMNKYIFMRPGPHEKTVPADLFWWQGADGTKVLTYRIQQSYNDSTLNGDRMKKVVELAVEQPTKNFMYYYGAGDHGGGATKDNMKSIEKIKAEGGAPALIYSTPERYFKEIEADKSLNLQTVNDDLQHHAVGCYTAESMIKKGNRQSEAALVTAEKIATLGSVKWGYKYPKKELTTAWQRVLFLQFHDSLAGSSLFDHSQDAAEGYGFALDTAHQATYMAVQKLEWQIASEDPDSQYLVVFNPHAWEVNSNIEYDFNWGTMHKTCRAEDEKGQAIPHQWTAGSSETGSRRKIIINTSIPAMGYRQIRIWDGEPGFKAKELKAEENRLENEFYKLSFASNGALSIFDKENNKEVFAAGQTGCKAVVIDDPSDTWSHNIKTFSKEIGAFGRAEIKILENGPVRSTLRVKTSYGASNLTIDWSLSAGSRNIEAKVTLDWHEQLKMLKFSFPVNVETPTATYETPYGHIVRATNGDEDPGQRWIDVSGKSNGSNYGLTVLNDAKYGYNVMGNDMRISVVRSAPFAHHDPKVLDLNNEYIWMDQGIQTFRMLLVPHKETWKDGNITRIAEEFIAPPVSIYQGIHGGKLPKSGSFLSSDKRNIVVSSVKLAEDSNDVIIRCVEAEGVKTSANLDLAFAGIQWNGNFNPFEIKTLRISKGKIREVNLLEE
jgi:alpha-mannosidase